MLNSLVPGVWRLDLQLATVGVEVVADRLLGELVVPGCDRGVCREHGIDRDRLECRGEVDALAHHVADALEREEGRVPLVNVPDGRLEPHRRERPRAADAEHDFLLDARGAVPAVEPIADRTVGVAVRIEVGVEQIKRHVAGAYLPYSHRHGAAGEINLHPELGALVVGDPLDRQVLEDRVGVGDVLHAFAVDLLGEIALAVEQPDGDERQAHVACRLAVIAREDAEASGVDREAFVETELEAEVGDEIALTQPSGTLRPSRLAVIGVVRRQRPVEVIEEHRVGGSLDELLFVDPLQERLGAVADRIPELRVHAREELARGPIPAVPEVVGELLEPRQPARDLRVDFECVRRAWQHRRSTLRVPTARRSVAWTEC
jgi:hypothetical protein